MQSNEKNGRDFYALAWRWHFYAGLFEIGRAHV